ncbi:MAG TPA: fasciclin domain-containing protein, partial [Paracoccaceae bacterium]|nr:fasciclin domain-containing protein [Paracoccaceae bacterium]
GDMVKITDGAGGVATVTIADVMQSNGVIHVIDTVMVPK